MIMVDSLEKHQLPNQRRQEYFTFYGAMCWSSTNDIDELNKFLTDNDIRTNFHYRDIPGYSRFVFCVLTINQQSKAYNSGATYKNFQVYVKQVEKYQQLRLPGL